MTERSPDPDFTDRWQVWLAIADGAPAGSRLAMANAACRALGVEEFANLSPKGTRILVERRYQERVLPITLWLMRTGNEHEVLQNESLLLPPILVANALIDVVAPSDLRRFTSDGLLAPLADAIDAISVDDAKRLEATLPNLDEIQCPALRALALARLGDFAALLDSVNTQALLCPRIENAAQIVDTTWVCDLALATVALLRHMSGPLDTGRLSTAWLDEHALDYDQEALLDAVERDPVRFADTRRVGVAGGTSRDEIAECAWNAVEQVLAGRPRHAYPGAALAKALILKTGVLRASAGFRALVARTYLAFDPTQGLQELVRSEAPEMVPTVLQGLGPDAYSRVPDALAVSRRTAMAVESRRARRFVVHAAILDQLIRLPPTEELTTAVLDNLIECVQAGEFAMFEAKNRSGRALETLQAAMSRAGWITGANVERVVNVILGVLDSKAPPAALNTALDLLVDLFHGNDIDLETVPRVIRRLTELVVTRGNDWRILFASLAVLSSAHVAPILSTNPAIWRDTVEAVRPYVVESPIAVSRIVRARGDLGIAEIRPPIDWTTVLSEVLEKAHQKGSDAGDRLAQLVLIEEVISDDAWRRIEALWPVLHEGRPSENQQPSFYGSLLALGRFARVVLAEQKPATARHLGILRAVWPSLLALARESADHPDYLVQFSIPAKHEPDVIVARTMVIALLAVGYCLGEETAKAAVDAAQNLSHRVPLVRAEVIRTLDEFAQAFGYVIEMPPPVSATAFYAALPGAIGSAVKAGGFDKLVALVEGVVRWGPDPVDAAVWVASLCRELPARRFDERAISRYAGRLARLTSEEEQDRWVHAIRLLFERWRTIEASDTAAA